MQVFVFLATVVGGIYFLIFNPESQVSQFLIALMPLGWGALFALRFATERKKRKIEKKEEGPKEKKKFKDPSEYIKENDYVDPADPSDYIQFTDLD